MTSLKNEQVRVGMGIKFLVIAPSLRLFHEEMQRRFSDEILCGYSNGTYTLKSGDTYRYISQLRDLRGVYDVKVLRWLWMPRWTEAFEFEDMVKNAELPSCSAVEA